MKIKEILSEKELKRCSKHGLFYNKVDLEMELSSHVIEMEIKDFIEFRKLDEIKAIKNELIRMNEREEY